MSAEVWRAVRGYEGRYSVSDLGNVRNDVSRRPMGQCLVHGYSTVKLSMDGKGRTVKVSVLVALAFLGGRPVGAQVCHNDGDRTNNRLTNLRYDTAAGNQADRRLHGTDSAGERNPKAKLTAVDAAAIRADRRSLKALAAIYGVSKSTVCDIRYGRTWAEAA